MEDYRPPPHAVLGHCPTLRAYISDDHGTESDLQPGHVPGEEDFEFSRPTAGSDHDYPLFSIRSLLSSPGDSQQATQVEVVAGDFCMWTPRKRTCKARRQRGAEAKDGGGVKHTGRSSCRKVLAGFLGGAKGGARS